MPACLTVNGESRTFPTLPKTLSQLLESLNISAAHVIIEKNKTLFRSSAFDSEAICQNDEIEIIHFMGGGSPLVIGGNLW